MFADLSPDQIADHFYNWLLDNSRADAESACAADRLEIPWPTDRAMSGGATGTVNLCGRLMIQHLNEWREGS